MQLRVDRGLLVDIGFLTALIALPAVPLIAWRSTPLSFSPGPVGAVFGCWLAVFAAWLAVSPSGTTVAIPEQEPTRRWFVNPLVSVLLMMLTLLAFYMPVQINFWGGADEVLSFVPGAEGMWRDHWDRSLCRPLVGLPTSVATHLLPNRIEGFVFVGVFLCFANGWLLFQLLSRLLPRATSIAVVAAILLIVHRADPLRFFIMWASNHYETVVFFLLLSSWLFVLSYERQSRTLLAFSCAVLGFCLLSNEAAYPSAALVPLLALAVRREWKLYAVWVFAWYGTTAMLAFRFAYFHLAMGFDSYQGGHVKSLLEKPELLLTFLRAQLKPIAVYFSRSNSWRGYSGYAIGGLALASLAVLLARRSLVVERVKLLAVFWAAVAVLCGVLPFIPLEGQVLRTQFIVAPAEATLIALVIGFGVRIVPARIRAPLVATGVGLISANAIVAAVQIQERHPSPVRFERTVHLFRQVHATAPSFVPDTLVVFVLENSDLTPLGYNSSVGMLAKVILDVYAQQANYKDPLRVLPVFGANGVGALLGPSMLEFGYDQVVAFSVKGDGSAKLLRKLPENLLPTPTAGAAYNPVARMRPGPFTELPYIRYPFWSTRIGDVVVPEDGMMLGDGWGPLTPEGSDAYRLLLDGAELVVNSRGATHRDLTLELQPSPGLQDEGSVIEVRNGSGAVVGSAPLVGRSVVHLDVPVDPERVDIYRLYVRPDPGSAPHEGAPGAPRVRAFRKADGKRYVLVEQDIFRDGLVPGNGWYGLEHAAARTFHWVSGDAELDLRYYVGNSTELSLKVDVGPACGGNPCTLEVRDESDHLLVTRSFRHLEELRIPVPPGYRGRLRLHVKGGGTLIPKDSRVLDYCVYSCGAGLL
jgi:hypothetical protein